MVKLLKESKGYERDLDLEKVLTAMGWLPAEQVTGMNSYSCTVYAMYDGTTTIEVAIDEGIDVWEYSATPETVCQIYEEGLSEFGYYPKGVHTIDEIIDLDVNGIEKEIPVRGSFDLTPAEALWLILPYYNE